MIGNNIFGKSDSNILSKQTFVALLVLSSCFAINKSDSEKDHKLKDHKFNLVGTEWYNDPYVYPNGEQIFDTGDSLVFFSDNEVRYFIGGELSFPFISEYLINNDTLILKTKLQNFEEVDVSNKEPNLIQKYLIFPDSLGLIYSAHKRNNTFIEADFTEYTMANGFIRIR